MIINSAKLWEQLRGRTAYEIAVINGYQGTQKEWLLTLKGPIGGDTSIFTLEEQPINKVWLDNRICYRKVIEFGTLPNAAKKSVLHEIKNIGTVTEFYAICIYPDGRFATFNQRIGNVGIQNESDFDLIFDPLNISIYSPIDNSSKTAYIILEYTKKIDDPLTQAEIDAINQNKGKQGFSAYDVAVKNGFVGTELEWLASMKKPALPAGRC